MDDKVFQERLIEIKHIGEEVIRYCQKKHEEICKAYEETCADNQWLQRCDPTQFLNESQEFKLCKETHALLDDNTTNLILDLETDDPREVLVEELEFEVITTIRHDEEKLNVKLQELDLKVQKATEVHKVQVDSNAYALEIRCRASAYQDVKLMTNQEVCTALVDWKEVKEDLETCKTRLEAVFCSGGSEFVDMHILHMFLTHHMVAEQEVSKLIGLFLSRKMNTVLP